MKNIINTLFCFLLIGKQAFSTPLSPSDFIPSTSNYGLVITNQQSPLINAKHVSTLEDTTTKSLEPIFVKLSKTKTDIIRQAPWALKGLYDVIYSFDYSEDNHSEKGNFSVNKYSVLGLEVNTNRSYASSSVKNPTVLFLQKDFMPPVSLTFPKSSCVRTSYPDNNIIQKASFNNRFARHSVQTQGYSRNLGMKRSKSDSMIYMHRDIENLTKSKPYKSLGKPMGVKAVCKGTSGTVKSLMEIVLKSNKTNNTLRKGDIVRLEAVLLYGNYAHSLLLSADYYLSNFLILVRDRHYLLLFLVFNEYLLENLFPEKNSRCAGIVRVERDRKVAMDVLTSILRNPGIKDLVKTLVSELLPINSLPINNKSQMDKKFNALINVTQLPMFVEKEFIDRRTFLDMLEVYLSLYSIAFMKTRLSSTVLVNKKYNTTNYNTTNDAMRYPRYLRNITSEVPVTSVGHNRCPKGCRKKCGCVLL